MNRQRSLRTTLFQLMFIPSLGVMLILSGVILLSFRLIQQGIIERQQFLLAALSQQGNQYLTETEQLMAAVSQAIFGETLAGKPRLIKKVQDSYPRFTVLFLLDDTGMVVAESTDTLSLLGLDMSGAQFFRQAQQSDQVIFSDTFISLASGQVSVMGSAPIFDNNQLQGVLVGELSLEILQQVIEQVNQDKNSISFIVDQRGTLLAHPMTQWVQEQRHFGHLALVQDGIAGRNGSRFFYDDHQDTWQIGRVTSMKNGWLVITTQPISVAAQPLTTLAVVSGLAFGLSTVLFLSVQKRSLRQITTPVSALVHKADALARGQYEELSSGQLGEFSEIVSLEQSFNQMAETVQEHTAQLITANETLKNELGERKRAEAALRESEERHRSIVQGLSDIVWLVDKDIRIKYVTPSCSALLGYDENELIGKMGLELVHPDEIPGVEQAFIEVLKNENPYLPTEFRLRHADGHWVQMEAVGKNMLDHPAVQSIVLTTRDITERKQAEEALRQSEERYRTLARNFPNGAVVLFDHDLRYMIADGTGLAVVGLSRELMEGKTIWEVFPPETCATIEPDYRAALAGQATINQVWYEGHIYHTHTLPVRNEQGQVVAGMVMTQDITERVQAVEALRQSEWSLANAQRLAHVGSWVWDIQTSHVEWSEEVYRIFGLDPETFQPQIDSVMSRFHPDDRELYKELISQAIANREQYTFEVRILLPDGSTRFTISTSEGHYDDGGNLTQISGTVQDITERKQAEEEIRKLNEQLEQRVLERTAQLEAANKELEAFAYSVSHDLRAPLRSINGFSQALLEDYSKVLDGEGRNYLQRVRVASQRMGQLIDDLLQLSRLMQVEMKQEPVDLSTLAQEIVDDLHYTQPGRRAEFIIQPGVVVTGDERLLRVVMENLLDNAWKFTGKKEEAIVEFGLTETDGGETAYFVRDNGAGFDMAYADKLFGAFQRLHSPTEFEGTGIGLATVQRIIHRHGGRVWAEGKVDKGTIFYFTLLEADVATELDRDERRKGKTDDRI